MPTKRVTIRDVARKVGVSHTAVSMALSGRGEISPARRKQILKVAEQMQYEPRAAARLLRAKKSNQLGAIVAARNTVEAFDRDFTSPILARFVEACAQRDLQYMIEFCHHDDVDPRPHQVCSGLVDGAVLIGDVGEHLRSWLDQRERFPWVSIGEAAPHAVLIDGEQALRATVAELAGLGHRVLAYAGGPTRYEVHATASRGFLEAARAHGATLAKGDLAVQAFEETRGANERSIETIVSWARELLTGPDRPTAVFCHGAALARSVITVALEMGLRVPRDLSVVSWGSPWIAKHAYPRLTTLAVDFVRATDLAIDSLVQQVEEQEPDPPVHWLVPQLVEGDTLGPVPEPIKPGAPI